MKAPSEFPLVMTTRDAQAYIPCKTLKGAYEWIRRHHIVRRGNGSIDRRDLDRAIAAMKFSRRNRGRHPNSRTNLRRRVA